MGIKRNNFRDDDDYENNNRGNNSKKQVKPKVKNILPAEKEDRYKLKMEKRREKTKNRECKYEED